eukprot:CAMPEP_0196577802 /NCGR_PEP_ID=MMETSP1081-20130531/6817_1 /TAXON_ID=36882 /ORGANISM="Pyramimonas amylifera, Strain CCMP720" /LENGTH=83 /DNA_ID=CAMNT_0041896825 /DNA_START=387 /DNA_END=638 /DNA_ORIENTATION=-
MARSASSGCRSRELSSPRRSQSAGVSSGPARNSSSPLSSSSSSDVLSASPFPDLPCMRSLRLLLDELEPASPSRHSMYWAKSS